MLLISIRSKIVGEYEQRTGEEIGGIPHISNQQQSGEVNNPKLVRPRPNWPNQHHFISTSPLPGRDGRRTIGCRRRIRGFG